VPSDGGGVPDLIRVIDAVAMTAYAGATWDWTQMHVDSTAARAAGFELPVVDGQMLGALLATHAQESAGRSFRVTGMSFRHKAPVLRGDRIRVRGRVISDDGRSRVLQQDIDVIGPEGEMIRRAIAAAETTMTPRGSAGDVLADSSPLA